MKLRCVGYRPSGRVLEHSAGAIDLAGGDLVAGTPVAGTPAAGSQVAVTPLAGTPVAGRRRANAA